jgi:hypothetical protein
MDPFDQYEQEFTRKSNQLRQKINLLSNLSGGKLNIDSLWSPRNRNILQFEVLQIVYGVYVSTLKQLIRRVATRQSAYS